MLEKEDSGYLHMEEVTIFLTNNSYTTSLGYVIHNHYVIIIVNRDKGSSVEMNNRSSTSICTELQVFLNWTVLDHPPNQCLTPLNQDTIPKPQEYQDHCRFIFAISL